MNPQFVVVSVKSMHVRVMGLSRTQKRDAHGVDLIISATPNAFDLPTGVLRTVRLSCGSSYSNINGAFQLRLPLCQSIVRATKAGVGACIDPGAALLLRFCLRHFNSDGVSGVQQSVRHTFAFGYVSLADLQQGHVQVDMVDFPAECEADWAVADPKSASPVVSELLHSGTVRSSRELAKRGTVEFRGVRVLLPDGVRSVPLNTAIDPLPVDEFRLVCYTRSDSSGAAGLKYIKSVFTSYITDVIMANHSGREQLLGFRPLMELARAVAPSYRLETGIDMPSALALMCMHHMDVPQEVFYENLFGCILSINSTAQHDYIEAMRSISVMYDQWRAGRLPDDTRLSHFQERCIELTILALCAVANSIPYTSDVTMLGKSEIITEWLVMRLEEEKAGDCEDLVANIERLWQSLVMNKAVWRTPLVSCAADVMDLYMCNINTTWSTECHILSIFTERTCLYHKLALGVHALKDQPYMTADVHDRCMRGVERTVFWDDFMYSGGVAGVSRARNNNHCYDSKKKRQWPAFLPPVYYAEGTRVCPPDNRSVDIRVCKDTREHHMHVAQRQVAMDFMASLDEETARHVRKLEPRLSGPSLVTRTQVDADPTSLSHFYECFISMSFTPPPLVLFKKLLWESRGGPCDVSSVRLMLERDEYFLYAMFHDRSAPRTFGVHHHLVANNDRRCALIPFGKISMELLRVFGSVVACEPPVLSPRPPVHTGPSDRNDWVGVPEPMPQLMRDPVLRDFAHKYHGVEGRTGVKCVRFFPHDVSCFPEVIRNAVDRLGSGVLAIRGRRCKLAASSSSSDQVGASDKLALRRFLETNNLTDYDVSEYACIMDDVTDPDVRHTMGVLYRNAPLCLNVLDVYVYDFS